MKHRIEVTYTKHPGNPLSTRYNIEHDNPEEAKREAKDKFSRDFGYDIDYITADKIENDERY